MTTREMLEEFERLTVAQRIQLVQDMWDRIATDPAELPPLSEGQAAELRRRMDSFDANPSQAIPADEVFAKLAKPEADSQS